MAYWFRVVSGVFLFCLFVWGFFLLSSIFFLNWIFFHVFKIKNLQQIHIPIIFCFGIQKHVSLFNSWQAVQAVYCVGFGWGSVNVLHSSWCGAVFWICAENRADDTGCFHYFWTALTPNQAILLLHMPWHQWGCKEIRRDTDRTTNPKCP